METRILIPSSLKIQIFSTSSVSNCHNSSPCNSEEKEEPTSSSACLEHKSSSSSDDETEVIVTSSEDETETSGDNEIGSSLQKKRKITRYRKDDTELKVGKSEIKGIKVCAKEKIKSGTRFTANEGEIQVLRLERDDISPLDPHDIRLVFGCVDRIIPEDGIRVCNWLRFLRSEAEIGRESTNIIGRFLDGSVSFELTKDIEEGQELIAKFDIHSLAKLHLQNGLLTSRIESRESSFLNNLNVPLDLSSPPEKEREREKFSQVTPKKLNSSFSISSVLGKTESERNPPNQVYNLRSVPILRTRGRERSLLPCEVCGKAFDRPSLLKRHMRTHTGEKPHVCDVCSKGFSTSSSLNTHRRIHSGEKPHQCQICGKRFTASSNLYYHRMTHNKEKPHKCVLCGKSFPTPGDLKSHQYVHSGSWPYNCPICHRGFSKQTNLRNHLLLHSGDKPHNCHICGKKFALACNLRAHLRTHEEEASAAASACVSCKRSFLPLMDGYCKPCLLSRSSINRTTQGQGQGQEGVTMTPSPSTTPITPNAIPPPTPTHHNIFPTSLLGNFNLGLLSSAPLPLNIFPPVGGSNPFLAQLMQWNYSRLAKEAAGNLGQLLESQMLAAHLQMMQNGGNSAAHQHPLQQHTKELSLPQLPLSLSVSDLLRGSSGSGSGSGSGEGRNPRGNSTGLPLALDLNFNLSTSGSGSANRF